MTDPGRAHFSQHWREIAATFLKLGATAYGGPAIMGIMQAEIQEKRQWLPKDRFVEGLGLANLLPGATATQLGLFLGYVRGGWWGGLLAGLCLVLPGFGIMLALTMAYAAYEATPILRGGLYGLGPVVLGIFLVAVYRLGRASIKNPLQVLIALAAGLAIALSPLGLAAIFGLAAGVGITRAYSKRVGLTVLLLVAGGLALIQLVPSTSFGSAAAPAAADGAAHPVSLSELALFFLQVGALTFGGGLSMIGFIQEQLVNQWHWLTPREFIDGLALGQFTPGPVIVVATYVGYKLAGVGGAAVAAAAIFLPSFVLTLAVLPVYDRVRRLAWMRAAMEGIGPAVIGILAVSLLRLAPHALPDPFAVVLFLGTLVALLGPRISAFKLILAGGALGVLRQRLTPLLGARALF
jgi:chromate transporter